MYKLMWANFSLTEFFCFTANREVLSAVESEKQITNSNFTPFFTKGNTSREKERTYYRALN